MVIMGANSLSIMVNNHIWMPFLLRSDLANRISPTRLPHLLLFARRAVILIILFIAYLFYHYTASQYSLVSLGMLSFAGIAQSAPAVFIGMYWKEGNVKGALAGILVGMFFWIYCLPFAGFMQSAGDPFHIISRGPFNLYFLAPEHFLGMPFLSPTAHAAFWSLFLNTSTYVFVSLITKSRAIDIKQANYFVDIYKYSQGFRTQSTGSVKAKVEDIRNVIGKNTGI
jgi:Na+/proline symporter